MAPAQAAAPAPALIPESDRATERPLLLPPAAATAPPTARTLAVPCVPTDPSTVAALLGLAPAPTAAAAACLPSPALLARACRPKRWPTMPKPLPLLPPFFFFPFSGGRGAQNLNTSPMPW